MRIKPSSRRRTFSLEEFNRLFQFAISPKRWKKGVEKEGKGTENVKRQKRITLLLREQSSREHYLNKSRKATMQRGAERKPDGLRAAIGRGNMRKRIEQRGCC
jgi:hypothetical protein